MIKDTRKGDLIRNALAIFRPSRRKLIIFIILLLFITMFLPTLECKEVKAAKKACLSGSPCNVTMYYSVAAYASGGIDCPLMPFSAAGYTLIFMSAAVASYCIACLADYFYEKYRNY
jgi:hypothetical protein